MLIRRCLKELCSITIKKRRAGRKKSKIAMNPHHPIQLTNPYRSPITLRVLFNEFLLGHRTVFINIIPLHSPRRFQGFQRSGIGRMPNNPGTSNQSQNVAYHEILASHALVIFLLQHLRNRPRPQMEVSRPKLETLESYDAAKVACEKQCFSESFRFHFLPKT